MGSQPRGISASRGAAVLGLSEYSTPLEVWQRIMEEREPGFNAKRGYVLPPEPDSAAIRWGSAFENEVIRLAEQAHGKQIIGRENLYCLPEAGHGSYITCHIDGHYELDFILHEGKTTTAMNYREKWGTPGTDRIPRNYQVQIQHQMMCTGAGECIVSVLVFPEAPDKWESMGWTVRVAVDRHGNSYGRMECEGKDILTAPWANTLNEMGYFHQYSVQANVAAQKLMVEAYREFWHKHVLTSEPPEARDYEDLKRLLPEPKTTIIVPEYIERKLLEYKAITEETAFAKKRKERLRTIILKYAEKAHGSGVLDDESAEAMIFKNECGDKLGSWSKNKNDVLTFRA